MVMSSLLSMCAHLSTSAPATQATGQLYIPSQLLTSTPQMPTQVAFILILQTSWH